MIRMTLAIVAIFLFGCDGGGGYSKKPWSSHYGSPEVRDASARRAYFNVPSWSRGEYPNSENRHDRESGNALGW
jgi:hypothetical protein